MVKAKAKEFLEEREEAEDVMPLIKPLWSVIGIISLATFNMNVPLRTMRQIMLNWIMKKRYC
jgi:hypothetical protein